VAYFARESAAKTFNTTDGCYKDASGVQGGVECNDLNEKISSRTTLAVVGGIGAAVFLAAGSLVLLYGRGSAEESAQASRRAPATCQFSVLGAGHGLLCAGTF
jgi:hypothetical protein